MEIVKHVKMIILTQLHQITNIVWKRLTTAKHMRTIIQIGIATYAKKAIPNQLKQIIKCVCLKLTTANIMNKTGKNGIVVNVNRITPR